MRGKLSLLLLVLMLIGMLSGCALSLPRPEIKDGEFDFCVTYELCGEVKTISGVYVCEYDGITWSLEGGYHRAWKGYIKEGTIEEQIKLATSDDGGVVELNLYFDPNHFMGDSYRQGDEPFVPQMSVRIEDDNGLTFECNADLIAENYGARVISYECDDPIDNTFQ